VDLTSANTTCGTCAIPADGSLTNHGDGTFSYTPNPDFNGPDSFVYQICDTASVPACDAATVAITVTATDDPPVAHDDNASTSEDMAVIIDVAGNDTDADGDLDPTTANSSCANGSTGCLGAANGSLSDNADGTITYSPDNGFSGPDSFVYEICDTGLLCDTATVSITVNPPVALVDAVSSGVTAGSRLTISHTTSGADRLMLAGVSMNNNNFETVSSITCNGVPLTYVNSQTQADDARVEIWKLVDPPVGTHDVVITFSAAVTRYAVAGVATFTGVDQTDPLGPFVGASATSISANLSVPSASRELVLGVFSCETCNSVTFSSPAAEQWNLLAGNGIEIGSGLMIEGAGPQVTINASLGTSDHWAMAGVSIRPGSSGPPTNDPPVASDVAITGAAEVGRQLTGSYTYSDVEGDPEGASTYQWRRGGTPIPGATAQTYPLVAADEGALIVFEVTPAAAAGNTPGLAAASAAAGPVAAKNLPEAYDLNFSASSDRANASLLEGLTVSGDIYVFVDPGAGIDQARFYLDDPLRLGPPIQIEGVFQFDFAGTASDGTAMPYNTLNLPDGPHSITVESDLTGGGTEVRTAYFTVANFPPALEFTPDSVSFAVDEGGSAPSQTVALDTNDATVAGYAIVENTPWLTVNPMTSFTPDTLTISADATGLAAGFYVENVTMDAGPGYLPTTLTVVLTVGASFDIQMSLFADRSNPAPLDRQTVTGDIYPFISPDAGVSQVSFYLDDPGLTGSPFTVENLAPWDAGGTASNGDALPYAATQLSEGSHTFTARIELSGGGTEVAHATFIVAN
jgi:hypothetical protein